MLKTLHTRFLVYVISILAALTGLLFGYDTGVISGAILFIKKDFALTPSEIEITISGVLFGALVGSAICGPVTDHLGRRKVLVITASIFILGSIGTALAPNMFLLVIGRILLGIAIGIGSFTAPLYLAEIAPLHIRGMLVSLNQLAITIGILFSYIVDYSFAHSEAWRWMLGLGVIPAVILLLGTIFLPESPRWMVLRGWNHKAKEILQNIRNSENVNDEFNAIVESVGQEKRAWRLLLAKWLRPVIFVALGLAFFQQTTGINTIIYYAPTIFEMIGSHGKAGAILATMGIGVVNVLFTILALPLIDHWGRRPLLLFGLTGMFISLAAIGIAFQFPTLSSLGWVAMSSMVLYIACFAMSLGPIMWLVISEIFPLQIRGTGSSLAVSASWGFNMLVAITFLTLIQLLGPNGTFWIYACLCVLGWLFVYFIVPETKNCSLEQIENNLRAGKPARELGYYVKK